MIRRRLPDRRLQATATIEWQNHLLHVSVGFYADGRPGEVFAKRGREQGQFGAMLDKYCIAVSMGLQHGCPVGAYVRFLTTVPGPGKAGEFEPETPMDAILCVLKEFSETVDIRPLPGPGAAA